MQINANWVIINREVNAQKILKSEYNFIMAKLWQNYWNLKKRDIDCILVFKGKFGEKETLYVLKYFASDLTEIYVFFTLWGSPGIAPHDILFILQKIFKQTISSILFLKDALFDQKLRLWFVQPECSVVVSFCGVQYSLLMQGWS